SPHAGFFDQSWSKDRAPKAVDRVCRQIAASGRLLSSWCVHLSRERVECIGVEEAQECRVRVGSMTRPCETAAGSAPIQGCSEASGSREIYSAALDRLRDVSADPPADVRKGPVVLDADVHHGGDRE